VEDKYLLSDESELKKLNNYFMKLEEFFKKVVAYASSYKLKPEDKNDPIPKPIILYAFSLPEHKKFYKDTTICMLHVVAQAMKYNQLQYLSHYPGYMEIPLRTYLRDNCINYKYEFKTKYGLVCTDRPIKMLCDKSRLLLMRFRSDIWILTITHPNLNKEKLV
jgi:hypothetical protein